MSSNLKLEKWLWVAYPIVAIFLMIFGVNYWLSMGDADIARLTAKPEETQAEENVAATLREKLEVLKNFDKSGQSEILKRLVAAVPVSKKAWYMVSEFQVASSNSGAAIMAFKSVVGDVKEASDEGVVKYNPDADTLVFTVDFDRTGFGNVAEVLRTLEGALPLIKIYKIDYSASGLKLWVEGAWFPWQAVDKEPGSPLPLFLVEQKRALERIGHMNEVQPY